MYWVRSGYRITCIADIHALVRVFAEVGGELTCKRDDVVLAEIAWCASPFAELLTKLSAEELVGCFLVCRLVGPNSVKCVAMKLDKSKRLEIVDPALDLLVDEWAGRIDKEISSEMRRRNDRRMMFQDPVRSLPNVDYLLEAARRSKYATLVVPTKSAIIATNETAVYLSCFKSAGQEDPVRSSPFLQFDIEDGFDGLHDEGVQERFEEWKRGGYQGELFVDA
jgi:hypothetical protein